MAELELHSPPAISESKERALVFLLCCLAAIHVFFFSAAFPFFNNVDEQLHFDLAVKYSEGHVPRALETVSTNATPYVVIYGSHEYLWPSNNFPSEQFPPPWTQPMEKIAPRLWSWEASWNKVVNHEASQPPLYYTLAGLWWRLGAVFGFHDGYLLYWLRFLNGLLVAALVWLGFVAARMIFPENRFLKLGVPALLAFMPQTAFYSIQDDVLSPLCFGAAFICLVRLGRAEMPDVRLGTATGLALAATYLAKVSNLPLLAVSGAAVLCKTRQLFKTGNLRRTLPALATLFFCAVLPMAAWLAWCKIVFGDFTGSEAKIKFLGWTHKPFAAWWHHPIFTPHGFWTFLCDHVSANGRVDETGNLTTFWQGEILWHRQPLAIHGVDLFYVLLTLGLLALTLLVLLRRPAVATAPQRQALWLALSGFAAALLFFAYLSIIYDFQNCFYPSRGHPYFTSGRLLLGALVPFQLLLVYGLDRALHRFGNPAKFLVLVMMILFMLGWEIAIDRPIFPNAYNWFHM